MTRPKESCKVLLSHCVQRGPQIFNINIGGMLKRCVFSTILAHGHAGQLPGAHEHRDPMLIYVCFALYVFLMFKHWLCWKYQYTIYMFNFMYIQARIQEGQFWLNLPRVKRRGADGNPWLAKMVKYVILTLCSLDSSLLCNLYNNVYVFWLYVHTIVSVWSFFAIFSFRALFVWIRSI